MGRNDADPRRDCLHERAHHRSGKLVTRGKAKRADYILYYKPNIPIAIIEAKDNNHSVGDGMQQALNYAVTLNIQYPLCVSSNGDGFVFHDRTGANSLDYLVELQRHAQKLAARPADWMPWNYRASLECR